MLDSIELGLLSAWCRARAMRWHPLRAGAEATTLLLEPHLPDRLWQRMLLTVGEDLRLEDEAGDVLAIASDLPALLDALDGGVADVPAPRRPASAYVGAF